MKKNNRGNIHWFFSGSIILLLFFTNLEINGSEDNININKDTQSVKIFEKLGEEAQALDEVSNNDENLNSLVEDGLLIDSTESLILDAEKIIDSDIKKNTSLKTEPELEESDLNKKELLKLIDEDVLKDEDDLTPVIEEEVIEKEEAQIESVEDNLEEAMVYSSLVINEICPEAQKNKNNDFVEIKNLSNEEIDLGECRLRKETESGNQSNLKSFSNGELILPGGFWVWAKKNSIFEQEAQSITASSLAQSNCVILECANREIDRLCFADFNFYSGHSLSRKHLDSDLKEGDFFNFISTPRLTPGRENHFFELKLENKKIYLNEVMSNPKGVDKGNEWIEIYSDDEIISLKDWMVVAKNKNNLEDKGSVYLINSFDRNNNFLLIKFEKSFLRNSDLIIELLSPIGDLVDRAVLSEVARDGQSFSLDKKGSWHLGVFTTPGFENKINQAPKIKVDLDDSFYKDIYVNFDASKTQDPDGDTLKFKWDFGNGRYSYKAKTRHRYKKKGKYQVVLRVDDGSKYFYRRFKIEVKSFPKLDVKLVGLRPNPLGKDKGQELIYLYNASKKKVNLFDWFLATGKTKERLVSHKIYDDFWLKAGELKAIINEDICKFSLFNTQGRVHLLYPNLEIASKVKYQKDKILENEEYKKISDQWQWICQDQACLPRHIERQSKNDENKNPSKNTSFLMEVLIDRENRVCLSYKSLILKDWQVRNNWWIALLRKA